MGNFDFSSLFFQFSHDNFKNFIYGKDLLTLTEEDLQQCRTVLNKLTIADLTDIYAPLSRLLYLYYTTRESRSSVIKKYLGSEVENAPFVIAIAGSVSAGKSTAAALIAELMRIWPCHPKVSLISTDGFLLPNRVLIDQGILHRKGFPVSYDTDAILSFICAVKKGLPDVKVPVYSHETYDIIPDEFILVNRPNILIIEGINAMQTGADYPLVGKQPFFPDLADFSIFLDATEQNLFDWYLHRFCKLRAQAQSNPNSYFKKYADMSTLEALEQARKIWFDINHINLVEHILPSRDRANVIIRKTYNHAISDILVRK